MTDNNLMKPDDIFILSNAGFAAIAMGEGERARSIMRLLQLENPRSAVGSIMEALHLHSVGETDAAISVLSDGSAFSAEERRDDALSLFVVLLKEAGRTEEASKFGKNLIANEMLSTDAAKFMVGSVVEAIEGAGPMAAEAQPSSIAVN